MRGGILPFRRPAADGQGPTDNALVSACASGDPTGLAELYDRHAEALARFFSRMGHVDGQDVEDLVHDVFLAAYRDAGRFQRRSSVRTWLFAIGAHLAGERARSSMRRRDLHGQIPQRNAAAAREPDDVAHDREALARLEDGMRQLTHDQRVAFVLVDVEGTPGVEAARALGMPSGTLYRLVFEARRILRDTIEGGRR